jgi:predicted dehydrogenase
MKRREFIHTAALMVPSIYIVPRHTLGGKGYIAPSEKLNIAAIGIGGMGVNYIKECDSENIVALCDVDDNYAEKVYRKYPKASRYRDFRNMLEKEKGIDAVIIGTPDHTHALPGLAATALGKHIYCAKPLTRTIEEARVLTEAARNAGVATQMSIQSNATEDHRVLCEMIWSGMIGQVREVHIWSDRPVWPQGIDRPNETPPVPDTLDWDLFLGPAPKRPYHPIYTPFNWRGWWDFGTGALGDMGCHGFDPIVTALKLTQPSSVQASSTNLHDETGPSGSIVHYDFPARENYPAVKLTWYDGGLRPRRPEELGGKKFDQTAGGILFIGSEAKILCDGVGNHPKILLKDGKMDRSRPPQILDRSPGHYKEWILACKGEKAAEASFDYGGPLTEMVLLGNLAIRIKTGEKLEWDYEKMKITNHNKANRFISEPYNNGWTLN